MNFYSTGFQNGSSCACKIAKCLGNVKLIGTAVKSNEEMPFSLKVLS